MEVSGPEHQLVTQRKNMYGMFQIVYDTGTRNYLYIHRKNGVRLGLEYAGTDQAGAIAGFDEYINERSITV
jgi:predicted site-specific integrase-resolvase